MDGSSSVGAILLVDKIPSEDDTVLRNLTVDDDSKNQLIRLL